MKKIISLGTLSLLLALTGCGGDSDSSGSYKTTYKQTLTNGNVYNCPSASAKNECTTDATCSAQKCELIKEVVPVNPTPNTPSNLCKTLNGQILVEDTKACQFINQSDNTQVSASCQNNQNSQKVILNGKIKGYTYNNRSFVSGAIVQNYRFLCR